MIIGLVGKPSAGKSTFFKAATLAEADIANYPFTTIKPNHGVGYVSVTDPAQDFGKTSNPRAGFVLDGQRFIAVDLMDVAGLVPGAHAGHGMGNQFLDDLRQADVLLHIIDTSGSTNEKGEPVDPGTHDPATDVRFLLQELDHWYYGILKKGWEKFSRQLQQEKQEVHKALGKQLSGLHIDEDMVQTAMRKLDLDAGNPAAWSESMLFALAQALRKASKPMVIVCNKIDAPNAQERYEALQAAFPEETFVPCSAESELALREAAKQELIDYVPGSGDFTIQDETKLSPKQKQALRFIKEHLLEVYGKTGVQEALNTAVFDTLEYIAVFPGGVGKLEDKEGRCLPDAFLVPGGATALDFAYQLHTDFGKHFIKAVDVRTKRTVGKEHKLQHGDIIEIMANA